MTRSTLHLGHRDVDALGVDPGVGQDLIAFLDGGNAPGMGDDLALEDLAGPAESLGVVDVGVGGDDHLAGGQAEIHLPDQFQHVGQLVEESDVDQGEFGTAIDQVDVHTQAPPRLVVHLQDAGKQVTPLDHAEVGSYKMRCPDRYRPAGRYLFYGKIRLRINETGNKTARRWNKTPSYRVQSLRETRIPPGGGRECPAPEPSGDLTARPSRVNFGLLF